MLKRYNNLFKVGFIFIVAAMVLSGCSEKGTVNKNDETGVVNKTEQTSASNVPGFAYYMDGENKVYIDASDSEVNAVGDLVSNRNIALSNKDYNSTTGDEEYKYYSEKLVKSLKDKNDAENSVKLCKDKQVSTKFISSDITDMKLDKASGKWTVTCKLTFKYTSLSEEYAKSKKIDTNANYQQEYVFTIIKNNDGNPVIDEISEDNTISKIVDKK